MNLSDFKVGDKLIITSRSKSGEFRRAAEVVHINYNNCGKVTYAGDYSNKVLMQTGQGAFDPAEIGKHQYGFYINVEIVRAR